MEKTKHEKGGSAFLWGFILGALCATLLTTKKGRQILRDLTDLGIELVEEFMEGKSQARNVAREAAKEEVVSAKEDIESEITEVEMEAVEEVKEEKPQDKVQEAPKETAETVAAEAKTNGNGHAKKRLFRGIRKTK